jgi:tripartite-type tricarboxylate transporter receptor subunit TctC
MKHAVLAVAGLLLGSTATGTIAAVAAEAAYPTKPIRLIIPFVPGGPSDFLSRLIGGKLGENLGQQVIPDNRGSAGGILGFEMGAKATPDGYTLLMAAYSGYSINPHVYKKLPYDPLKELQPITQLTLGGNIFLINPSVNAKTLKEFIALARTMPGKMNYGSTGAGPLLATERFKKEAGINLVNIPYKGTGQAQIALLSNEIQFFIENPLIAVTSIKTGKVRPLAVTSLKRNPVLPDLPTVAEAAGLPGYENITWHSFAFPAGVPKKVLAKMHEEIVRVLNTPEVGDKIRAQGLETVGNTPEQLSTRIRKEHAEYGKLVKEIGYQPQ